MEEIRKILNEYKEIPLSDTDMMHLMEGEANIITYSDLHKFTTVDELLHPYDVCFILYTSQPHYGHWTLLIKRKNDEDKIECEFFDSYGLFPDTELNLIPEPYRTESNQDKPLLSQLLYDCDYELYYNEMQLQSSTDPGTSSCGRWCCIRAKLKDMDLKDFQKLFSVSNKDDIATVITMDPSQIK